MERSPLLACATSERRSRQTSSANRTVSFGKTVTLRREDGREQTFRIVGEDEADSSHGTISYVSPLARAVLTHGPGDTVEIAGGYAIILDVR
jgi:transcription elongation GreA/GreB family factor